MATDPRLARATSRIATAPQPPPPPPPPEPIFHRKSISQVDGTDEASSQDTPRNDSGGFKLKFCTVCASNQNRSMEAHLRLSLAAYPVISFGTGSLVRLPGPSITQPNVYSFNTTSYESMHSDLTFKNPTLYRQNGVLNMIERNRGVKWGPERWQDWPIGKPRLEHKEDRGATGAEGGVVDVVITCEERCWDAVVDNLLEREGKLNKPVHVINVDIKDNHEEALIGGRAILDLADNLNAAARDERGDGGWKHDADGERSFDRRVPDILAEWQERWPNLPALWTLAWF